jgi:hypothetical protein
VGAVAVALGGAAAGVAQAGPVLLTLEDLGPGPGQAAAVAVRQSPDSPCVFGGARGACADPLGWHSRATPGPRRDDYALRSFGYTVGELRTQLGGDHFAVGLGITSATRPEASETLLRFVMLVNGVVEFAFRPGADGMRLPDHWRAGRRADALLEGFDLSRFADGDRVVFRYVMRDASGGRERFFLVGEGGGAAPGDAPASVGQQQAEPMPIPEPGSAMTLLFGVGIGLGGLRLARRRRRSVCPAA